MHVTAVVQGIRGIFPLIKQHAPHCITTLSSFAAIPRATRLAIDATLLVQRLHFADDQHAERHVIGFNRLIKQLREHGLIPIMVFDNFGQGARLPAKTREHERRRSRRSMLTLRAKIEAQRANRLHILKNVLQQWSALPKKQRLQTAQLLREWSQAEKDNMMAESGTAARMHGTADLFLDRGTSTVDELQEDQAATALDEMHDHIDDQAEELEMLFDEKEIKEESMPISWEEVADQATGAWSQPKDGDQQQRRGDAVWSQIQEAETSDVLQLAARIRTLRRQHASQVIRAGSASSQGMLEESPTETATQQAMTQAEGEVYARLEDGLTDPQGQASIESAANRAAIAHSEALSTAEQEHVIEEEKVSIAEAELTPSAASDDEHSLSVDSDHDEGIFVGSSLSTLAERNAHMQRYYVRSSASLSPSIFEACASLCEMVNVPVLWTGDGSKGTGKPHEAEAMASMLVRHGYADVVVSEDSDVLLYDVPLLRGVMGHKKLELIDSAAVRRSFFPPRDAQSANYEGMDSLGKAGQDSVIDAERSVLAAEDGDQAMVGEQSGPQSSDSERDSRRQMLDFALLCGTDFNRTIPGIAARRALKLIRDFGSIEGIRQEAARRANQDRRKGKSDTASTTTITRSHADPESNAKVASPGSLVSSLRNESGLRLPDDLTWREYSKELTQARRVFEHPPTLFWQLRKVRDLKRDRAASLDLTSTAHAKVDHKSVKAFLQSRGATKDHGERESQGAQGRERPSGETSQAQQHTPVRSPGFGASPFGDGGRVATWP